MHEYGSKVQVVLKRDLIELFLSWELRIEQAVRDDTISPGMQRELNRVIYSYVGQVLRKTAEETEIWIADGNDANKIPQMIHEHADWLLGKKI